MKQPTDQEWQEVLEWCGFRYKPDELCGSPRSPHIKHSYGWLAPDDYKWEPDTPPIDLNNLFQYAVPKVLEEHDLIETYSFKQASGLYYSETTIWDKGYRGSDTVEVLKGKLISKAFTQEFDLELANTLSVFWAIKQAMEAK